MPDLCQIILDSIIYLIVVTPIGAKIELSIASSTPKFYTEHSISTRFPSICKITDVKAGKLFYDKIVWRRKTDKWRSNKNVFNFKHPFDNNPVLDIHNIRKRDNAVMSDKIKEQKLESLLDNIEEDTVTKQAAQMFPETSKEETKTILMLFGLLIMIALIICMVCQQLTEKFERGGFEIQTFMFNGLSDGRSISEDMGNGERRISLDFCFPASSFLINSDCNVQITHCDDAVDLPPPTYEEAIGIVNSTTRTLQ